MIPDIRRLLPVRLTEIRLDVRFRAAVDAAKDEGDEGGRQALLSAAIEPSDTVYYVTEAAREQLGEIAA